MNVAVIGDRDMVSGYALAGVKKARFVADDGGLRAAVKTFLADSDLHVIIVQDTFFSRALLFAGKNGPEAPRLPVIVAVPGRCGPAMRGGQTQDLIRQVVGIPIGDREGRT
jgi:vacuolar-type H+-ATPase subunit F/Vma7